MAADQMTRATAAPNHPILFVGAGPGDPELITVKGRNALLAADVVVYAGSLVPEELLAWTRPGTPAVNSASMRLEDILATMAQAYRSGKRVVRLHTGDPSLYGALFEQISGLCKLGIPFKIIPGVTAAFAAAAALGIEYTLPEIAQTLILTRMAGRTPVPDRENLASLAAHQTSMAIYLSIGRIEEVAATLIRAYGEQAPCAVVYQASQPGEKVIRTRLSELAERVAAEGIRRQALVIVGRVLEVEPEDLKITSRLYDKDFEHGFRK